MNNSFIIILKIPSLVSFIQNTGCLCCLLYCLRNNSGKRMRGINNLSTGIFLKKCKKTIIVKPSYMNINSVFQKHLFSKLCCHTGKNPLLWILPKQLLDHLS